MFYRLKQKLAALKDSTFSLEFQAITSLIYTGTNIIYHNDGFQPLSAAVARSP
ncbi:hypothetical protein SAMN05660206_101454 [Sphingobacterium wenxiniae]|uniref:Uncharacterized protein n=1 Tax=Sphingobacterium wenxiniae TaxID=683125 RepID=A0A1I6PGF2_9SPHI|nr:hypothetical protein SAMN05660206_101454 [Sphingobacterium wenxiniae]